MNHFLTLIHLWSQHMIEVFEFVDCASFGANVTQCYQVSHQYAYDACVGEHRMMPRVKHPLALSQSCFQARLRTPNQV